MKKGLAKAWLDIPSDLTITRKNTKIKYLTDGMLLRSVVGLSCKIRRRSPGRSHEVVNTDVLFGILKKLTSNNNNNNNKNGLKVVVTARR